MKQIVIAGRCEIEFTLEMNENVLNKWKQMYRACYDDRAIQPTLKHGYYKIRRWVGVDMICLETQNDKKEYIKLPFNLSSALRLIKDNDAFTMNDIKICISLPTNIKAKIDDNKNDKNKGYIIANLKSRVGYINNIVPGWGRMDPKNSYSSHEELTDDEEDENEDDDY